VAGRASACVGSIGSRLLHALAMLSTVVLFAMKRVRPIGYALLMMIVVTPC